MVHAAATVWQRCGVAGRSGLVQWQQARLPALERASCTGRVLQELSLSQPLLGEEILSAVSNLLILPPAIHFSSIHTRLPSLGALILLLGLLWDFLYLQLRSARLVLFAREREQFIAVSHLPRICQ
jgi:hypothetical protein